MRSSRINLASTHPFHHKIYRWTGICAFLLLTFAVTGAVGAQNQVNTSHSYTYGQNATFDLILIDATTYDNFVLYIEVTGMPVTSYNVERSANVIQFNRNLRESPFPPYNFVTYWWEYEDSNQTKTTTEKTIFQYTDNRYSWQSYTDKDIVLYWVNGDNSTIINATSITWDTLNDVENNLKITSTPQIEIYFYPSSRDLQSALQLAGYNWVSGAAYPELGVILLSVTEGNQALNQLQKNLPHELIHKVLYDEYGANGYNNLPVWLVEGLASYFEPYPDPAYKITLQEASSSATLLKFDTLCYPFPDNQQVALLSYAQSESLVAYIQKTYGWSKIRNLLQLYAEEGIDCATGIEQQLGRQTNQLEKDWRVWFESQSSQQGDTTQNPSFQLPEETKTAITIFINDTAKWIVLCALLIVPFIIFSFQTIFKKNMP